MKRQHKNRQSAETIIVTKGGVVKGFMAFAFASLLLVGFQKKQIEWRTLVPLITTRTQVEAELGPAVSGTEYILVYDTTEERLTVRYGGAKKAPSADCKWDIAIASLLALLRDFRGRPTFRSLTALRSFGSISHTFPTFVAT
jgi:hypothetical protein